MNILKLHFKSWSIKTLLFNIHQLNKLTSQYHLDVPKSFRNIKWMRDDTIYILLGSQFILTVVSLVWLSYRTNIDQLSRGIFAIDHCW